MRRTQQLFDAAVEKRLMSDVPFGVLLSGGIDSSANVAVMSKLMDRPVRTFTVGFSDHEHLNELDWARRVATHFKTDHHEVMVDEKAMREYLPSLVFSQDEPIADWVCIPLYFVSKLVRDSGTIVVQVGEGSDEQFCRLQVVHDVPRHVPPLTGGRSRGCRARRGARRPRGARPVRASTTPTTTTSTSSTGPAATASRSGAARRCSPESRKARLVDRGRLEPLAVPAEMAGSGLLPEAFGQADSYEIVRSFFDRIDKAAPGTDVLNRMIYSEFKLRLPELLLMRVDKIGMSVSIEPRVPFLDHLLVELTMNLPMELKVEGGIAKGALQGGRARRAARRRDRPAEDGLRRADGAVAARRRSERRCGPSSCRAASSSASRRSRQAVVDMLDRHREGRAEFALYVWTIYNAVAWFDYWVDKSREVRVA